MDHHPSAHLFSDVLQQNFGFPNAVVAIILEDMPNLPVPLNQRYLSLPTRIDRHVFKPNTTRCTANSARPLIANFI